MKKRILVLTLAALGFAAAGCSTPAVPADTSKVATSNTDTTYLDYQNCIANLPVGWSYSYCDGIRSAKSEEAMSFEQFTAGSTKLSREEMQDAYKSYLSTLDSDTLQEMSAQWQAKTAALQ